jgi:glycine oxidase
VIIGGGVIGCALAYYLSKQRVKTLVVERGAIGGQASGAAAGLLAPLGPLSGPGALADLLLAGFRGFPALVGELEAISGLRLGYEQTGALRTVQNSKRLDHLRKRWENWQPLGLQIDWLDGDAARQQEPLLAPGICAAVYAPQEAQVDARKVTSAFAQGAQKMGAQLWPQQEVVDLATEGARVNAVRLASGERVLCEHVIIAAGAWTGRCGAWLAGALPVQPLHGQLLACAQTSPPLRIMVLGMGIYLLPRAQEIIVGSTREERGFEQNASPEGTAWLRATAARLVPQLATTPVTRVWTGLRPKTPDTRPLLGYLPGWKNVIIAAGHNSTGILLSGITGACVAELLLTGQPPALIRPFTPQQ